MYYIIDRIENDIAICESDNLSLLEIPVVNFLFPINEQLCFKICDGAYIVVNGENRKQALREKFEILKSLDKISFYEV